MNTAEMLFLKREMLLNFIKLSILWKRVVSFLMNCNKNELILELKYDLLENIR